MHRHVSFSRGVVRVGEDLFNLDDYERMLVIAIGKAAIPMVEALLAQVGSHAEGIVAGPRLPAIPAANFRYFAGGHPLPNEESLRAGEAILNAAARADEKTLVMYLISGGGSALAEKPVRDDISFDDIVATNRTLVGCGAPIAEMNAIRKHLSALKGGRLAQAAYPAQQVSVLVSDVPEGALDMLASGPSMPDSSTTEDCYRIAQQHGLPARLPASAARLFSQKLLEETPKSDDAAFVRARWTTVLSNATVVEAAAHKAREFGHEVFIDNSPDDWDYRAAADHLLDRLRSLRREHAKVCLISGGEVTVRLPESPGIGGRNQQFTLYCAGQVASERICVLSAGTDGVDGNSPAAGAVADGTSLARYSLLGMGGTLNGTLRRFDAYPFFHALEDAIEIGPTGNNVRDLRLLLAW